MLAMLKLASIALMLLSCMSVMFQLGYILICRYSYRVRLKKQKNHARRV